MSKFRYQAAIFDMDGTILDTLDDLTDSVNHVLGEYGFAPRARDEVRLLTGEGARNLVTGALPAEAVADEGGDALIEDACGKMKVWYKAHCAVKTRPYDGMVQLLQSLRAAGIRTAVVSNKPDAATNILSGKYFPGCFDTAWGERPDVPRKPAPDAVLAILTDWGIAPQDAVYIGDSDTDILTAANAGLPMIGVTWGFRGRAFLEEHGAAVLCETPEELKKAILGTE